MRSIHDHHHHHDGDEVDDDVSYSSCSCSFCQGPSENTWRHHYKRLWKQQRSRALKLRNQPHGAQVSKSKKDQPSYHLDGLESRDAPITTFDTTANYEARIQSSKTFDYDDGSTREQNDGDVESNHSSEYIGTSPKQNTFESCIANMTSKSIVTINRFTKMLCSNVFVDPQQTNQRSKGLYAPLGKKSLAQGQDRGDHLHGDDHIMSTVSTKKKSKQKQSDFTPPTFVSFPTKRRLADPSTPPTLNTVSTDVLTMMIEEVIDDLQPEVDCLGRSTSSISFDYEGINDGSENCTDDTFETVSLNNTETKDYIEHGNSAVTNSRSDEVMQTLSTAKFHRQESVKSSNTKDSIDLSYDLDLMNTQDSNISFDEDFDVDKKTFLGFNDTLSSDGQSALLGYVEPMKDSILKDLTGNTADDDDSATNSLLSYVDDGRYR